MQRLIIFIVIFALFLAFTVINLEHRTDISVAFHRFEDIPVFLPVFFSFVLGMLFALPLFFLRSRKKKQETGIPVIQEKNSKKKRISKRFGRNTSSSSGKYIGEGHNDQIKKEDSQYGID